MKSFEGKVAPWYIALFAAMMIGIACLYIWVVPGAGQDQTMVSGLLLIAAACSVVITGAPIKRNRVEILDSGFVDVVFGVWRTRISLEDVAAVERCHTPFALGTQVAACSGDCVRILTRTGGAIVIALKENQAFIDALEGMLPSEGA